VISTLEANIYYKLYTLKNKTKHGRMEKEPDSMGEKEITSGGY
jgi:hypothetical protein